MSLSRIEISWDIPFLEEFKINGEPAIQGLVGVEIKDRVEEVPTIKAEYLADPEFTGLEGDVKGEFDLSKLPKLIQRHLYEHLKKKFGKDQFKVPINQLGSYNIGDNFSANGIDAEIIGKEEEHYLCKIIEDHRPILEPNKDGSTEEPR